MNQRFRIRERDRCVCTMRRFAVTDTTENVIINVHVGHLNPLDAAHMAVKDLLDAERQSQVLSEGESK